MKETYFLTKLDYWLIMRMIDSAWESKRPKLLVTVTHEIYNKHHLIGVRRAL